MKPERVALIDKEEARILIDRLGSDNVRIIQLFGMESWYSVYYHTYLRLFKIT